MATWAGEVELRKLQVRYSRAPTGGVVEDVAVTTHHFLKLAAGEPSADWLDADYSAIEGFFTSFWSDGYRQYVRPHLVLDQYRWYVDGPAQHVVPTPANPAVRVTEVNVVGTSATLGMCPPQVAISFTERTSVRSAWGRFYMPAPTVNVLTADGRLDPTPQDVMADKAEIFYNACRGADLVPVVFSVQKPERARKSGSMLPAQDAIAYEVEKLQVDNIVDVIRSRRWATPTLRDTRTLAAL